jgi:antitoxin FitA
MKSVLIRDLSDETHQELLRRAQQRGQSLQQYLVAELTRLAASPILDDVLRRIEARRGGRVGLVQAVADLADERARG